MLAGELARRHPLSGVDAVHLAAALTLSEAERDAAYIWDMLEAVRRAYEYAGGTELKAYLDDDMIQAAVERVLGIVGEAARARICDQTRIWRLISERVPELIAQLEDAMPLPPALE
jgi:uncharacterized protein with HEPN domain